MRLDRCWDFQSIDHPLDGFLRDMGRARSIALLLDSGRHFEIDDRHLRPVVGEQLDKLTPQLL
jgi:hypothetical protein